MNTLTIIFIAFGLSMDTFAVSACEGLSKAKVRVLFAVSIAFCFAFFQTGMTIAGYFAGSLFAEAVENVSHWAAFGLLSFIGGRMIYSAVAGKKGEAKGSAGFWELILLGVATSIDALAVGVNFALSGNVNISLAAGIIAAITFLVSIAGVYFGKLLGNYLAKYAELMGGVILVIIGIRIVLGGQI